MKNERLKISTTYRGFSLIEMAVVLAIISVIVASGLSYSVAQREEKRYETTQKRIEFIMQAVDDFVDEKGYIPCPADPTLSPGSADFGFGGATGDPLTTVTQCNSANIVEYDGATNVSVIYGAVPVYSLNIPPEYIFDGWNRRLTYVVDEDLTYVGTALTDGYLTFEGDIEVRSPGFATSPPGNNMPISYRLASQTDVDNGFTDCTDTAVAAGAGTIGDCVKNGASVAIVSHGSNGFGAYGGVGGAAPAAGSKFDPVAGSDDEDENADHLTTPDEILIQSIQRGDFDDIVDYKLKWQLNVEVE